MSAFSRYKCLVLACCLQLFTVGAAATDCEYLLSNERLERIPAYSEAEARITAVETLLFFLYDHPLIRNLSTRHLNDRDLMSLFHLSFGYQDNTQLSKSAHGNDRAFFAEAILVPSRDLHSSGSPLPPRIDVYANMQQLMTEARRHGTYALLREPERDGLIDTLYESTIRIWKTVSQPNSWRKENESAVPTLNVSTKLYNDPGDEVLLYLHDIHIFNRSEWDYIHRLMEIVSPDSPNEQDLRRSRDIEKLVKDYLRLYLPEILSARGMTLLTGLRSEAKMEGTLTGRNIIRRDLNKELSNYISDRSNYLPDYAPYVLPKPFDSDRMNHLAGLNFERLKGEIPTPVRFDDNLREFVRGLNKVEPVVDKLRELIEAYEVLVTEDLHNVEGLRRKIKFQIRSMQNKISRHLQDLEDAPEEQKQNLPAQSDTLLLQINLGQEQMEIENIYNDQLEWFEQVQRVRMMIVTLQIQRHLGSNIAELDAAILASLKQMAEVSIETK